MIIVTGGAGFIGSAVVWKLNQRGISDILIVDHLGESEKWKNLVNLRYNDYMDRELFIRKLEQGDFGRSIETIFHLGACSATTEKNADYLMENNFHYTARLAQVCIDKGSRFIYASSAATYGSGDNGYSDSDEVMEKLKPLNMYGYSKHLFDVYALKRGWLNTIAGLKFFNVFGPNEYHKGDMRSLICKSYPRIRDEGSISLFKSHKSDYKDGEQIRDFIYIKDAVEMILFFFDNSQIGGVYNIGTGVGHSWNDLANYLFAACGKNPCIQYVDMPLYLREKYQYFTTADQKKLASIGCTHKCMPFKDAIFDYVTNYLEHDFCLGE